MTAHDFTLYDTQNTPVTLSSFLGKMIILYFYPKDNTPGCTQEACDFRDSFAEFGNSNAVIIGISPDSEKTHKNFQEKHSLPFILLSDPEREVAKLYDVYKLKKLYGKESMGIERSTFIINQDFNIIKEFRKVKVNGHIIELLNTLSNV